MKREKVFRTIKRVMAILGIILIVLMYAATFIAAVFVKKYTVRLFLASMIMTMVVPLLLYAYRDDNENFSAFERSGSGIAVGQSKGLCRGSRYKSSSFFTVKIITISDDIMTMTLNAFFLAANCVIIIAAHNFSAQ